MVDQFLLHEFTYPRGFSEHGWGQIVTQPLTFPGKDPSIQQHNRSTKTKAWPRAWLGLVIP
jgi:hypothetical protein